MHEPYSFQLRHSLLSHLFLGCEYKRIVLFKICTKLFFSKTHIVTIFFLAIFEKFVQFLSYFRDYGVNFSNGSQFSGYRPKSYFISFVRFFCSFFVTYNHHHVRMKYLLINYPTLINLSIILLLQKDTSHTYLRPQLRPNEKK